MVTDIREDIIYQTFFVSHEKSRCPLISECVRLLKSLSEDTLCFGDASIFIGLRYGKRMLMNIRFEKDVILSLEDFVEIVDYDPVKKLLVLMGTKSPPSSVLFHWLLFHARKDIHVIVQFMHQKDTNKGRFPSVEVKNTSDYISLVEKIIPSLEKSNAITLFPYGDFFVGRSLKEIEDVVYSFYKV
jgi:hypothetical protein